MNPQQPQVVPDPTNTPDPSTTDLLDEQVKPRRNRSISKLEKLTGRRESLEQVKVYIEVRKQVILVMCSSARPRTLRRQCKMPSRCGY